MLTVKEAKEKGWSDEQAPLFVEWLKRVNNIVVSQLGVGIDDLPDWGFADAFEDKYTPNEAAAEFIDYTLEDSGFSFPY
jgi:hypothetical protein